MIPELEALKRLLLHEWDPIGIRDCEGAQDEYDSYAFELFTMLSSGADVDQVASYLDGIEAEHMALRLRAERNRAVAVRAVAIHAERDGL